MLEVRGPIGGYFVWDGNEPEPVLLVAGGSGVVPLMAMLRHRARTGATAPMRLLLSSRTLEDVIYRDELDRLAAAGDGFEVVHTLTREQPPGWTGYSTADRPRPARRGRLAGLRAAARVRLRPDALRGRGRDGLVELGYEPASIRTERFGATGS